MSTQPVNVRFLFWRDGPKLSEAKKLRHMWLAYTAATQNGVVPVIIFIRGLLHCAQHNTIWRRTQAGT
ncbi:hypothetical protein E4U13_004367 [Claviceps humidiphila]|uniref:Uncharacterized protein n=1 Tax=Claviceps humidiphila TaxID=1294629 RepID=A0A9P7TTD1_9HYPO|nr:hypothetical protein E4U13_004367 [Claviceps humidiphila]